MSTIHDIHFPRFHEDVAPQRRTLFHMPVDDQSWANGDRLRLIAHPNLPRCMVGVLVDVRQVRLLDDLDAQLVKLCALNRDEYLARWDVLHPKLLSANDPLVWRIEFRYGGWDSDPPEWSLAS